MTAKTIWEVWRQENSNSKKLNCHTSSNNTTQQEHSVTRREEKWFITTTTLQTAEWNTHPSWCLLERELQGQGSAPFSSTLQLPKGARDEKNWINESSGVKEQKRKGEIKYWNGLSTCPSQQSQLLPLYLISTFLRSCSQIIPLP